MAIAFLFLGPVPFIPVETKLSIIQGMVGLVGFGYALVMVSSFGRAQTAAPATAGIGAANRKCHRSADAESQFKGAVHPQDSSR